MDEKVGDAVAEDLQARHGRAGITALIVALSRQYGAALAGSRGIGLDQLLDEVEADNLAQIPDTPQEP
ncbi:hypothetical protein [Microlunatus sp. GCM10028923]|uniref:hypothetical protein n=1 Tax=Microlunatus sp. GCM10028923 TaxID=3273400 RepID=UPI00361787E8